ncbi:hypothetical protein F8154_04725 [Alkaliphilus pronyensis]|uniref:DUF3784 domain-containing protein n=1 Tax=Alkaliphilus pronyensis TaxID=1482732 RepID=A0A6I0FBW7_9FIRM|nr:hypothetical protein [Alkaliphilus pronyensis]KAB3536066.1 hypothetical protein F8154_04725 [Alkaliphilus pronyensis]
MNNNIYKKTYKPLIGWLIGFPVTVIIISRGLSNLSSKLSTLVLLIFMVISMYLLMLIIYKGEYVYWINGGPNFEEAKSAGSEKRKKYAKAHLDIFFKMLLIALFYGVISLLILLPTVLDILFIFLLIIISALSTIKIKFNK